MGHELTTLFERKGFTLIELIVVLAILSMVMVIVLPQLPSSDSSNLQSSARSLAATIRYLGENSVTGRIPYRLRLNISDASILVTRKIPDGTETSPDDVFLNKRILAEGITIESVQTPRLGNVKEGLIMLDFGPSGVAEFVNIHLQGAAGRKFTVMAFPGNGKVKLYEGYQEVDL